MRPDLLVRRIRDEAHLSLRALAKAADVATSTVHRIEKGELHPTVDTLDRIAQAAGVRLHIDPRVDSAASLVGLARTIRERDGSGVNPVRLAAELVGRFRKADRDVCLRMILGEPPSTGDARWDAFLGALAEWLAMEADLLAPEWAGRPERFLGRGWWITPMKSMQAWEYAGTPVSFKTRGVFVHRDSLVNA